MTRALAIARMKLIQYSLLGLSIMQGTWRNSGYRDRCWIVARTEEKYITLMVVVFFNLSDRKCKILLIAKSDKNVSGVTVGLLLLRKRRNECIDCSIQLLLSR